MREVQNVPSYAASPPSRPVATVFAPNTPARAPISPAMPGNMYSRLSVGTPPESADSRNMSLPAHDGAIAFTGEPFGRAPAVKIWVSPRYEQPVSPTTPLDPGIWCAAQLTSSTPVELVATAHEAELS